MYGRMTRDAANALINRLTRNGFLAIAWANGDGTWKVEVL